MDCTEKRCSKCNILKEIEHFTKHPTAKSGYCSICKPCLSSARGIVNQKPVQPLDQGDIIVKLVRAQQQNLITNKYKDAKISVHLELIWNFIHQIT